ncbi:GNAT family N-acetyltransferase [Methanoculleus caldifontis]|nr:N-acetyltransferase [Methanoculleus sp. Wushi-C6]
MILEPFNPKRHSIEEVAGLIYDTEPAYFPLVFGRDREKALLKIESLILAGGNAFGHDSITCAVRAGRVAGVLVMQAPDAPGLREESLVIARAAGPVTAARFLLAELLIFAPHYLKRTTEPEYYISGLSVVPAERGRGIGAALLEGAVRQVRSRGGGRTVLSVIAPNPLAVRLYERAGLRTVSAHRAWVPFRILSVLTMIYDPVQDGSGGP